MYAQAQQNRDADQRVAPSASLPYAPCAEVSIAGRTLSVSPVFDTYWRFAARRQAVYERRQAKAPAPWTDDDILQRHRFTNCYRAADRVSQYLIQHVIYAGPQDIENLIFRTLLFKLFNRISTWQLLERHLGELSVGASDLDACDEVFTDAFRAGTRLYSAAYVMPPPRLGALRKHSNHLLLLQEMMSGGIVDQLGNADGLADAFRVLLQYPAIGKFLAYQFAIDINYSDATYFEESEYVVAGPGALDGIRKCFGAGAHGIEADVIRYMADSQEEHFERLGLLFNGLRGRRLQLVDCQNLFCEVDKYSRVAHPDIAGISGRTRIKQSYAQSRGEPLMKPWFPPKWHIN